MPFPVIGLCVPTRNLRGFTLFRHDSKCHSCPFARCMAATNAIHSNIGIFWRVTPISNKLHMQGVWHETQFHCSSTLLVMPFYTGDKHIFYTESILMQNTLLQDRGYHQVPCNSTAVWKFVVSLRGFHFKLYILCMCLPNACKLHCQYHAFSFSL